jgi:hypothetical protein
VICSGPGAAAGELLCSEQTVRSCHHELVMLFVKQLPFFAVCCPSIRWAQCLWLLQCPIPASL